MRANERGRLGHVSPGLPQCIVMQIFPFWVVLVLVSLKCCSLATATTEGNGDDSDILDLDEERHNLVETRQVTPNFTIKVYQHSLPSRPAHSSKSKTLVFKDGKLVEEDAALNKALNEENAPPKKEVEKPLPVVRKKRRGHPGKQPSLKPHLKAVEREDHFDEKKEDHVVGKRKDHVDEKRKDHFEHKREDHVEHEREDIKTIISPFRNASPPTNRPNRQHKSQLPVYPESQPIPHYVTTISQRSRPSTRPMRRDHRIINTDYSDLDEYLRLQEEAKLAHNKKVNHEMHRFSDLISRVEHESQPQVLSTISTIGNPMPMPKSMLPKKPSPIHPEEEDDSEDEKDYSEESECEYIDVGTEEAIINGQQTQLHPIKNAIAIDRDSSLAQSLSGDDRPSLYRRLSGPSDFSTEYTWENLLEDDPFLSLHTGS